MKNEEYNDCVQTIREIARAIRSNSLSPAERNEIAGNLTIAATRLERLAPITVEELLVKQGNALAEYRTRMSSGSR